MSGLLKVAIGTVGIGFALLLVLFPIFQEPSENRYRPAVGCASNMKQIGLALIQYSQDYDNNLPLSATASGKCWREAVFPFVQSTGIYRCPDDKSGISQDTPQSLPMSYALNVLNAGKVKFADPANTIALLDTRGDDSEEWNTVSPKFLPSAGRVLYAHIPPHAFYEHPAAMLNVLLDDGHVKRLAPMATLAPVNLWTANNKPFAGQDLVNAQAILKHAEDE